MIFFGNIYNDLFLQKKKKRKRSFITTLKSSKSISVTSIKNCQRPPKSKVQKSKRRLTDSKKEKKKRKE